MLAAESVEYGLLVLCGRRNRHFFFLFFFFSLRQQKHLNTMHSKFPTITSGKDPLSQSTSRQHGLRGWGMETNLHRLTREWWLSGSTCEWMALVSGFCAVCVYLRWSDESMGGWVCIIPACEVSVEGGNDGVLFSFLHITSVMEETHTHLISTI